MAENTRFWDLFSSTPKEHTKEYTGGGGFRGTEYKPVHMYERLTKVFGPVGVGWGWEIVQEETEDGACFGNPPRPERLHTVLVECWYTDGEKKIMLPPQYGCTVSVVWRAKKGQFETITDAKKMSVTDGVAKSFQSLGMVADILKGEHGKPPRQGSTPAPSAQRGSPPPRQGSATRQRVPDPGWAGELPKDSSSSADGSSVPALETRVEAFLDEGNIVAAWGEIKAEGVALRKKWGNRIRTASEAQVRGFYGRANGAGADVELMKRYVYRSAGVDRHAEHDGDHLTLVPAALVSALYLVIERGGVTDFSEDAGE